MARNLDKTTPDDLSGAYRAVWRWHFYAGVFVMPVLMLLALTGVSICSRTRSTAFCIAT